MMTQTHESCLASPLDPFLGSFLRELSELADGYSPTSHGGPVAARLDWAPAFVEAMFTSARARGLLEPYRAKGARGRARWRVSERGRTWLMTRSSEANGEYFAVIAPTPSPAAR